MISFEEARRRVSRYLGRPDPYLADQIELMIVETIERPWGWVFFYDSADHIRSGSFEDMIAGNAPILVERASGSLFVTGTAESIEHYIALYEQGNLEDLELVNPDEDSGTAGSQGAAADRATARRDRTVVGFGKGTRALLAKPGGRAQPLSAQSVSRRGRPSSTSQ